MRHHGGLFEAPVRSTSAEADRHQREAERPSWRPFAGADRGGGAGEPARPVGKSSLIKKLPKSLSTSKGLWPSPGVFLCRPALFSMVSTPGEEAPG